MLVMAGNGIAKNLTKKIMAIIMQRFASEWDMHRKSQCRKGIGME